MYAGAKLTTRQAPVLSADGRYARGVLPADHSWVWRALMFSFVPICRWMYCASSAGVVCVWKLKHVAVASQSRHRGGDNGTWWGSAAAAAPEANHTYAIGGHATTPVHCVALGDSDTVSLGQLPCTLLFIVTVVAPLQMLVSGDDVGTVVVRCAHLEVK